MELDVQQMIFQFLGGLGIFLFAIKYLGDALQRSAGDRLREILDRFTTNPLMGVLAGIIVTILIQSSSGTTVLTVGLVNAGFMTLKQAIGVVMGANIGTTATAFIIGIPIKKYALPIIAVGTFFIFFFKSKKWNNLGQVLFGFGALFYGLSLMSNGMKPLRTMEAFHDLTVSMSDTPLLGVVIGTAFTVIVQSSSATIGVLQSLFAQGAVSLDAALPVLFGDNIGTTITAVLASIGASIAARRTALTHVIFNLIGATIFILILGPYTNLISWIQQALHLNEELTIAFAHGIFNMTNTLIQFPFIAGLAFIVTKLIPGEDIRIEHKPKHLEQMLIQRSPAVALGQAKEETLRMANFSYEGLKETYYYLKKKEQKHADMVNQYEAAINHLDREITEYLVSISSSSLSGADSERHNMLLNATRDIERIGDHMENISELVDYQLKNKVIMTDSAMKDLEEMFELTLFTLKESFHALDDWDKKKAEEVLELEDQIDKMERTLRKKHIGRLNEGSCTGPAGIVFVDMISNLERIGDHAVNIAQAVIGE